MRKKIYFILFLIVVFSLTLSASLLDIYKSGKIKFVPDPNFGKGTEWDLYFPQGIMDIAFAKDGSFFATGMGNKACHCVYKFDKNGKFIKKIGRKGKGPGDLYHPGDLTILDNKYLLVNNYGLERRISVFDLNGNFVKEVKTRDYVFGLAALKGDYIAYLSWKSRRKRSNRYLKKYPVYIKNIRTGREKLVFSPQITEGMIPLTNYGYEVFIKTTFDRNLLLSYSKESTIKIFSIKGTLLKEIKIDIPKVKVTKEIKKKVISGIKITGGDGSLKASNLVIFHDYAEGYENIEVDSEGNILVFYNNLRKGKGMVKFKVYNKKGEYVCDSEIILGKLKQQYKGRKFRIYFNNGNAYCPVLEKEEDYKIIKVNLLKK